MNPLAEGQRINEPSPRFDPASVEFLKTLEASLAVLSRPQVARALTVSLDTLDRLHARGQGPPRVRISPRRWGYPVPEFRHWLKARLRETEK